MWAHRRLKLYLVIFTSKILNYPVFVSEIRLDANEIVCAEFDEIYHSKFTLKDYHIIDIEDVKWIYRFVIFTLQTPVNPS